MLFYQVNNKNQIESPLKSMCGCKVKTKTHWSAELLSEVQIQILVACRSGGKREEEAQRRGLSS
jgi:hypothetical protein